MRRVCYALQFLTGMCVGELAVLRWKDYDASMKPLSRLTIRRAVKSVSMREAQTKPSAVKLVPVHPALATVLDAWKATGWAEYMGESPKSDELIVPNKDGKVRNTNRQNRDLGRDCKRIGLEHRNQHAMRHTFITLVQDDGADEHPLDHARPAAHRLRQLHPHSGTGSARSSPSSRATCRSRGRDNQSQCISLRRLRALRTRALCREPSQATNTDGYDCAVTRWLGVMCIGLARLRRGARRLLLHSRAASRRGAARESSQPW